MLAGMQEDDGRHQPGPPAGDERWERWTASELVAPADDDAGPTAPKQEVPGWAAAAVAGTSGVAAALGVAPRTVERAARRRRRPSGPALVSAVAASIVVAGLVGLATHGSGRSAGADVTSAPRPADPPAASTTTVPVTTTAPGSPTTEPRSPATSVPTTSPPQPSTTTTTPTTLAEAGDAGCADPARAPDADLAGAVLGQPTDFTLSPSSATGTLDARQISALASSDPSADRRSLVAGAFVAAAEHQYVSATTGLSVSAFVFQFACPSGAREHLQLQRSVSYGLIAVPSAVRSVPGSVAFAADGADSQGLYEQVAAVTSGNLYVAVYVTSPGPHRGVYAGLLLDAAMQRVAAWTADPSSPAEVAPGPERDPSIRAVSGASPTCSPPGAVPSAASFTALLATPPARYVSEPGAPAGLATPRQFSSGASVPAQARAINRSLGLEGDDLAIWQQRTTGAHLQVTIFRFTCSAGAEQFGTQVDDLLPGEHHVTVPATIHGGVGIVSTHPDDEGHYFQTINVSVGDYFAEISLYSPTTGTGPLDRLASRFDAALVEGVAAQH